MLGPNSWNGTRRVYVAVAACAVVVYLGALGNRFAMDDLYVIVFNPLVHSASGIWRAFGAPYWPPDYGGEMYPPPPAGAVGPRRPPGRVPWVPAADVPFPVA